MSPKFPRLGRPAARFAGLAVARRVGTWLALACLWRPAVARAEDQQALLTVEVNHVSKGEVLVVLRGDPDASGERAPGTSSDALVGVQALEDLGIHHFGGKRESIGATPFVSLMSLAPRVTYKFDERALALHLTVQPDLLDSIVRKLASGRPPGIEFRRDASAYVNYAVDWRDKNNYDLFTDLGVSAHGAFFGTGLSAASSQRPVRGLSSATFDQPGRLRRLVVGDAFANGGLLGGGMLLGGVTFSKEYAVDPYFIQFPSFNLSGAVTTPTIAEIYVNDRLVRTEQLAPGQFSLAQLPITTGRNDARVVLRDAFGGVRDLSASYYLTTSVLAPGLHEYQYSVGFQRTNFGVDSWSYGRPAFIARHRVGLTNNVTIGGRLEGTSSLMSGGPVLNLRTRFGQLEAAGALSEAKGFRLGRAGSLGYAYTARTFSGGGSVNVMTPQYMTSSIGPTSAKNRIDANAFVSVRTGPRASLTVQSHFAAAYATTPLSPLALSSTYSPTTSIPAPPLQGTGGTGSLPTSTSPGGLLLPSAITSGVTAPWRQTSLIGSARLTSRTDLSATASLVKGPAGYAWNGSVGLNIRLGHKTLASVSVDRVDEASHVVTEIQQPLPVGTGLGYRFQSEAGDQNIASGDLQYQGPYGRYELRRDVNGSSASTTVAVSGGVVAMNGGLYATRAIQDAFALVRVPEVEGVRAYINHQEVGRTDKHGNVLVPNLQSYYGNVLDIADQDVPLEHSVGAVRKTVAPPYHGGALAVFPVQRLQSAHGTLQVDEHGSLVTPSYGQLTVKVGNTTIDSPIGAGGEFYLENLPAGRHEAIVEFREATSHSPEAPLLRCAFTLSMPVADSPSVGLGALRCVLPR